MVGIIRTEGVWKTYGQGSPREVNAVRDISIDIVKGEITALGGPSGSGKTTILSLLGLLTKPTKGSVYLEERELSSLSEVYRTKVRRERIGFIFQAQYLIPQLTSVENVALPKLCTDMSRADAESLAKEQLTSLGMENRLDFRVAELSGGEQQRVSIARALMNSPDILIADEPTTALDVTIQAQILDLMKELIVKFRTSILIITHDLGIIAELCDRIAVMYSGNIVEYATAEHLFKEPRHPYTQGLIGAIPSIEKKDQKLQTIRGMVPNLIYAPSGCRFHPRCDFRLEICDKVKPQLTEIAERYFVACHLFDPKYKDSPKYMLTEKEEKVSSKV